MPYDKGHRLSALTAVRNLRGRGWTLQAIADLFGVTRQGVHFALTHRDPPQGPGSADAPGTADHSRRQ